MRIVGLLLIVGFLLSACQSEEGDKQMVESDNELIDIVRIQDDPDNVLRIDVEVTMREPAALKLVYWKDGNESVKRELIFDDQKQSWATKLILLEEQTKYWLKVYASNQNGMVEESKPFQFITKALPDGLMKFTNLMPDYTYTFNGYIHVGNKQQGTLYLINAEGKVVWYQPTDDLSVICSGFDPKTKTFQAILGFNPNESFTGEYIYVVDLYGNVKLKKYYAHLDNPYFHHDIQMLDNGDLVVVNQIRQSFDLTRWGGSSNEMVTGDGFSILDFSGNTKWTWSAFDFISPEDDPDIMGDRGEFQYTPREDWLHANTAYPCPDGDFLVSFNRIRQVWKVDGRTGEVIYKLGRNGDVHLTNLEDFSDRQHAASLTPDGDVMIYDNGYTNKRSRVMAYRINEITKQAEVTMRIVLPKEDFSVNQSSAYCMDNDRILFGSVVPKTIGVIDKNGNLMWHYKTNRPFYRALYIDFKLLK